MSLVVWLLLVLLECCDVKVVVQSSWMSMNLFVQIVVSPREKNGLEKI